MNTDTEQGSLTDVEQPEDSAQVAEVASSPTDLVDAAALPGHRASRSRRLLARWPQVAVALLLVGAAAAATWIYANQYRGERQTAGASAKAVLEAATDGTVALLSYSPDHLLTDLAAAKTHLTGDFLVYYSKFSDQIVAPAAKDKQVDTHAAVVHAAVADLHPDAARVLIFLNQTTTSKDVAAPVQTSSSVVVSLTKIDGRWLISAFDPV